jgi:hypothetical protein
MTTNAGELAGAAIERHSEGLRLYALGRFEDAVVEMEAAFRDSPSSELANDLGAAELACGRVQKRAGQFCTVLAAGREQRGGGGQSGSVAFEPRPSGRGHSLSGASHAAGRPHSESRDRRTVSGVPDQSRGQCAASGSGRTCEAFVARVSAMHAAETAPRLPPPVYMGNHRALLCTRDHSKMLVDTNDLLIAPWLLIHSEWEPEETHHRDGSLTGFCFPTHCISRERA